MYMVIKTGVPCLWLRWCNLDILKFTVSYTAYLVLNNFPRSWFSYRFSEIPLDAVILPLIVSPLITAPIIVNVIVAVGLLFWFVTNMNICFNLSSSRKFNFCHFLVVHGILQCFSDYDTDFHIYFWFFSCIFIADLRILFIFLWLYV